MSVRMKITSKRLCTAWILTVFIMNLTACSREQTVSVEKETETVQLLTEADCRKEIAELGNDTEALKKAAEYYEELLARDAFTEDDYKALADVYEQLGDTQSCKNILWKLYRLYPTREHADKLSELIVEADTTDAAVSNLMDSFIAFSSENNATELSSLVTSDDWKEILWLDNGVISLHTLCTYQDKTLQITSGMYETIVTCLDSGGNFVYYENNEAGSSIIKTVLSEGAYSGDTYEYSYDADSNMYRQMEVTLVDNICTGNIFVNYEGVSYAGEFNSDGTADVEQIEGVDGVIYAYETDGNTYLYQPDSEGTGYVFDISFIDLPMYDAWK
jgi:tetratricopeptide (TPR) repeat protein